MAEVEYVARVVVERIERTKQAVTTTRRPIETVAKVVREKGEVMSFTVRAGGLVGIRTLVTGMMEAGMPDDTVKGEPDFDDDDEGAEEF